MFILVLLDFVSCTNETKNVTDNSTRYYLNKDNIEIIEFENNKIFRYFLRDSIKKELTEKNILYFPYTEDSLKIVGNDSLIYKKIELNTKDSFDLESSKYWTHKFQNKFQEWYSFYTDIAIDSLKQKHFYNIYSYYQSITPQSIDTSYLGKIVSDKYMLFNKFNLIVLGPYAGTLCLASKSTSDTIKLIPIKSFEGTLDLAPFNFIKYKSVEDNHHLGNWILTAPSTCEFSDYVIGNKLKIYNDSLVFSNNSEVLTKAKYRLGLDSNYFELMNRKNIHDLNMFWDIKILKQTETELKLHINYDGGLCKTTDTLIYKKINPQK